MLCDRGRCPLPPMLAPPQCCRDTKRHLTLAKGGAASQRGVCEMERGHERGFIAHGD